jgi:hypothetical protein
VDVDRASRQLGQEGADLMGLAANSPLDASIFTEYAENSV